MSSDFKYPSTPPPEPSFRRAGLRVTINSCLVAAGFISLLSQLIIFREFLNVFDGNELLIGLLLFTWMLFTAIGSFAGTRLIRCRNTLHITGYLLLLAGILPVISVSSLYYLKTVFLLPGISGGLTTAVYFASILLLPVCVVNGMLFSMPSLFYSVISGKNQTAIAYGYDTLGSVIAGILFTIVLSYLLSVMQTLFLVAAMTFLFYGVVFSAVFYKKLIFGLLAITTVIAGFSGYPDKILRLMQFPDQEILYSKDTPYGNVCVTGSSGQFNLFQNGILFYSTNNDALYEESVHFALLQCPDPMDVLVVSGGVNGVLKQVRKYSTVRRLDYAEVNPWLIEAETALMPVIDEGILQILKTDARYYIKQCTKKYDAIILNMPEPVNAQLNRYYTLAFFKEAKKALNPGGIFETSLGATSNYVSEHAAELNASVFHTLKLVFRNVNLVVAQKNYYIASDNRITLSFDSLLLLRPIVNDYVNPYYFDDDLTSQRSKMVVEKLVSQNTPINRDIHPVTYVFQIREWLTRSGNFGTTVLLILFLILAGTVILFLIKEFRAPYFTVFSAAFAGASAEFLLLIIFQILFGQIYQMLGILFAFYMAGLSAGAFLSARSGNPSNRKTVLIFQIFLFALVLLVPLLITFENLISRSNQVTAKWVIMIYTFVIAFVTGVLFGKSVPSTPLRMTDRSGLGMSNNLYGIDLVASAMGTLLTSAILFPVMGIWITAGFSSVLLLASFVFNIRKPLI